MKRTKGDSTPRLASEPVRLQKLIANAGVCSRRDAETLIEAGKVRLNGKIASLGDKATPTDAVFVENIPLPRVVPEVITLVMHKPRGLLCSNEDPHHARTIFDLLPPVLTKTRLFCAGRLDKDSEGMLILTNDGALANRLTHPTHRIVKRYRVLLNRPFDQADIPKLLEGVMDEGELLKAEKVIPAPKGGADANCRLEVHLNHGKKREIRRLFEANRYFVKRLQRFQIGGLILKGLPRGAVRELKPTEIERLLQSD